MRNFFRRRRSDSNAPAMGCAHVGKIVQSYLDSELDDETARLVSAHLDECRRCGLEASVYRDLKAALAHRTDPPTESVDRLRSFGHQLASGEISGDPDGPTP
ncbi:MAG: anti-sigma factor family protein [Microthrixaceae bacterium]